MDSSYHNAGGKAFKDDQEVALVLDRLSDGFTVLDSEWRVTFINEQGARSVGKTRDEMLGQVLWSVFPEAIGQPFHQAAKHAIATQEIMVVQDYLPSLGRWYENRIYPSRDGLSVFYIDITERKLAEELLVGQTRVLESMAHGASMESALDSLLRMVEQHCEGMHCSILLLDPDGQHLRHGAAPSLPESFTRPIDGAAIGPRAGACGAAAFLRQPVISEDIATDPAWGPWRELALANGLRSCWSIPIFDAEKRLLGTFAMYRGEPGPPAVCDHRIIEPATHIAAIAITRERAEVARRRSESRYRRLTESNVIGVLVTDSKGLIKEANDAFLRFTGFTRAQVEAGGLSWEVFRQGRRGGREREFVRASGQRSWLRTTAALVEDGEGESIWLVEDITERKEQARVRQKNRELEESNRAVLAASRLKSEFLANMSHELRTPLNAILGFSEFLLDGHGGPLTEKQTECLQHVLSSGRHLLKLVCDVLDLAKVEAGKLELFPDEFSVREVLEEVCSVAGGLAQEKQIALNLRCDPQLDRATLDPQKFKQIFFNLVANAVKFTDHGGAIEVVARPLNEEELEVRVSDTGIGIRNEDIPKLFHQFQQLDSGASRRHAGTGLGLALAKRLVESQHGHISVESELGVGSTFFVTLPRELPALEDQPS